MSQQVRILGFKLTGRPYLGDDENGDAVFARSGEDAARWLADAARARFNQQRSLRSKFVYEDGVQVLDGHGKPALAPIGSSVTTLTHAQARKEHPFLAAVPAMVLHHELRQENTAWFAAIKRRTTNVGSGRRGGSLPGFRSRKRSALTFGCFARNGDSIVVRFEKTGRCTGMVTLGGMNPSGKTSGDASRGWKLRIRVRLSQTIRPFTSIQVNLTTGTLTFASPPAPLERRPSGEVVGLDAGVVHTLTTSDAVFHDRPDTTDLDRARKAAQRRMARSYRVAKKDGRQFWASNRYQAAKAAAARAQAKKTRVLTDWQQKVSTGLVRRYDVIAIEDLNLSGMTRSARGTVAKPGKNVRQKAGLNRALNGAAISRMAGMLEYKTAAAGTTLVRVPAAYTSQRCNACGHIAGQNRESQAVFECTSCGHRANADVNAARNILDRATGAWGGTRPSEARRHQPTGTPVPMAVAA